MSVFDKPRIFEYESAFQFSLLPKGYRGLVDHSDDIGGGVRRAGEFPPTERDMRPPALLRSPLRPQFTLLLWLTRRLVGSVAGLVLIVVLAVGSFVIYEAKGPIAIGGLGTRIANALNARIGPDYAFKLGTVSVTTHGLGPTLSIDNLTLVSRGGATIITAPRAEVSVDLLSLLYGKVVPKRLEVFGIEVRLVLLPDGSLAGSRLPRQWHAADAAVVRFARCGDDAAYARNRAQCAGFASGAGHGAPALSRHEAHCRCHASSYRRRDTSEWADFGNR